MSWSVVPFGRYRGKTLPEIIARDLDWFFWMLPKLYGRLGTEARDLARKVRAIKSRTGEGSRSSIGMTSTTGFAALHSSKLRLGIRDGQSDFRTSTWRRLFVGRSITNEQAAS
jgi:hypothetical protein